MAQKKTIIKARKTRLETAVDVLRQKILSGELSTDGKVPSARDLAGLLNMSRDTAWRALVVMVKERFLVVTPTGRYTVHPRFRLTSGRHKHLHVAFLGEGETALENPFMQRVFACLHQNRDAWKIDVGLILGGTGTRLNMQSLDPFDAVILSGGWDLPCFGAIRAEGKIVIGLNAPFSYRVPCGVRIDDFYGGELAGVAFADKPVNRVVITGESQRYPGGWHEPFELRMLGFRRAWLQSGRLSEEIEEKPLPVDLARRFKAIQEIAAAHTNGTAYFGLSDSVALMLISALNEAGCEVPGEACVIGFDGSPEAARVELSTLCPAPSRIAEEMIKQIRIVEHEREGHNEIVYIKPDLILRKSLSMRGLKAET